MRNRFLLALVAATSLNVTARAELPEYTAYRPSAVYGRLIQSLESRGLSVMPYQFKVKELPSGRQNIARGAAIVGQVALVNEPQIGKSSLTIFDVRNAPIATFTEVMDPSIRARIISLSTALEQTKAKAAPYSLIWRAGEGVSHYRYGQYTNVSQWRYEFNDAMLGILRVLVSETQPLRLKPVSGVDRATTAIATDPTTAHYLSMIHVRSMGKGIVVDGIVPSTAAYSLIVLKLIDVGVPYRVNLIVDSRLAQPRPGYSAAPLP